MHLFDEKGKGGKTVGSSESSKCKKACVKRCQKVSPISFEPGFSCEKLCQNIEDGEQKCLNDCNANSSDNLLCYYTCKGIRLIPY